MTIDGFREWTRHRRLVCHASAFSVAAVLSIFMILLLDRREVITLGSYSILPSPAIAGRAATIIWRATEHRDCDGRLTRIIVDSSGVEHQFSSEPTVAHYQLQFDKTFSKTFIIPLAAAPGPAIYYARTVRWCNIVQEHLWPMRGLSPKVAFIIVAMPTEAASASAAAPIPKLKVRPRLRRQRLPSK